MKKLGFTKEQYTFEGDGDFKSNMAVDPNCGFNNLYVYCDAAEAITVGDTKAPLFRVVDGSGNSGETIHRLYTMPQYTKKEFHTVEIDIRHDTGNPVPFEFGKWRHYIVVVVGTSTFYHNEETVLLRD